MTQTYQQAEPQYILTAQVMTVPIAASSTSTVWFTLTPGLQPRKIIFPSNWTAGNVTFYDSISNEFGATITGLISNTDGTAFSAATIANQSLPLIPWFFDTTSAIQIVCSNSQSQLVNLTLVMQPIYQGVHN